MMDGSGGGWLASVGLGGLGVEGCLQEGPVKEIIGKVLGWRGTHVL